MFFLRRVDELYKYLQLRVPHLYGELCPEEVKARGFELVESDTELWEDDSSGQQGSRHSSQDGEISELTRESWEVSHSHYFLIVNYPNLSNFIKINKNHRKITISKLAQQLAQLSLCP